MNHKFSWNQLSDNRVNNALLVTSISTRRITIPETLYNFFGISEYKNINLVLIYGEPNTPQGERQFSATINCSEGSIRELMWFQHLSEEIRSRLWWEGIRANEKKYSTRSPIYLNLTKTHEQVNSPSESGKIVKCDVYKVSITETHEDQKSEALKDLNLKNIISKLPFGHIQGTEEGQVFVSREKLGLSGIHTPPKAGIWGRQDEGSASIVLSGGYADDIDDGEYILYTGQGGRDPVSGKQIKDQQFTLGNKGLQLNKEYNRPVRVTRGHQVDRGPDEGYRYDGLYYVTDYERVKGREGFFVCRFHLQKEQSSIINDDIEHPVSPSERVQYSGNRVKRNVSFAEQIKDLYDNTCQICKVFLKTPIDGIGISEAAHIKAIGSPHDGPDTKANMLCLCPNHHAQFDRYTFYIDPMTLEVVGLDEYKGTSISLNKKHKINIEYFEYQKLQHLKNKQK